MYLISPCVLVDDSALRITARLHPLHGTMCVLVGMVERQTNPIGKLGFLVDRAIQRTNQRGLARTNRPYED